MPGNESSFDTTRIYYGLVLRMDLEAVPDLKKYLDREGIKVIYQIKTINRIRVVPESFFNEQQQTKEPVTDG